MHPLLKATLIGLAVYVVVGRIPLLGGLLGWGALILTGLLATRWSAERLAGASSPAAWGLGVGALLGAVVATLGTIAAILLDATAASMGSVIGAFGALSGLVHLLIAPVVGGLWGGIGGLIGGAGTRRSEA